MPVTLSSAAHPVLSHRDREALMM